MIALSNSLMHSAIIKLLESDILIFPQEGLHNIQIDLLATIPKNSVLDLFLL